MEAKTEKTIKESLKTSSNGSEKSLADNEAKGRGFERWEGRVARGRLRGEPGPMKGLAPPGFERGPMCDGPMTGIAPIRAMRRMRLYPDLRGHRRRDRRMRMAPPPHPLPAPPSAPTPATPQAPPMHHRVPFPPRHGPPPPPLPNHPFFRGHAPHPQGPGMPPPGPPCHFDPRAPRGYYNGPVFPPPHCPPGRGQRWPGPHDMGQRWPGWSGRDQRWPGPPGGRRF